MDLRSPRATLENFPKYWLNNNISKNGVFIVSSLQTAIFSKQQQQQQKYSLIYRNFVKNKHQLKIDRCIYFVGADVARALSYINPRKAIKDPIAEEGVTKIYPLLTNGRIQQITIINESGLYSIILSSKLERN